MLPFSSPYAEHVRTNYIATVADRPLISHLVSDAQQRLENLEREISTVQATFDEKEKQRDMLDEEISRYEQILSPIRRFPDEVLSSIFLFCLPDSHNAVIDVDEPPLVFGYVSKRWRSVSRRTPLLWASIHIGLVKPRDWPQSGGYFSPLEWGASPTALPRLMVCHCEAVHQWLSRAGSSLLSISMDNEPTFRVYFDILKKFSQHWYKFGCIIYSRSDFTALQLLDADALPRLQHLSLRLRCKADFKGNTLGLLYARNLRFVSIYDIIGDITPELTNWRQITHLTLFDHTAGLNRLHHTLQDVMLVFKYCVRLVQCTLGITETVNSSLASDEPGQPSQLLLPYLERISMTDYEGHATPAFSLIITPSLQSVEYATNLTATATRPSPLVTLLSKNGGRVTYLQTDLRRLTYTDFTICVASTPQLSSLVACSGRSLPYSNKWMFFRTIPIMEQIMKPVFGILNDSSLGFCFWPRLESLSCDMEHTAEDKDILVFLLQRMESAQSHPDVSPLKLVKMSFNRRRQIDLFEALEQCCSRGLSLDLSYEEPTPARRVQRIFPSSGISILPRPGFPLL